jgi:hypothetical protein
MSELQVNKIGPRTGTTLTLGESGQTIELASGATAVGFEGIIRNASDPAVDTNPTGGLGTVWANTTSGEMFILTDATAGANVWKNVGDGTDVTAILATGGTISTYVAPDGNEYKVHKFTSSGANSFNVVTAGVGAFSGIDVLVVAGGGGGGNSQNGASNGAGGGAGGLRWFTGLDTTAVTYTATIGAGGGAGSNGTNSSFSGSEFNTINATGGGSNTGGLTNGTRGGSGGGGSCNGQTNGTNLGAVGNLGGYTPIEGNNGGGTTNHQSGGGGGGAGGAGGNVTGPLGSSFGGAGGIGASTFLNQSSIAFSQAETTSLLAAAQAGEVVSSVRYLAGGGGGGEDQATYQGIGGHGGGADGGGAGNGNNAPANMGGAGGGGAHNFQPGNGGSGIIIVRYRTSL